MVVYVDFKLPKLTFTFCFLVTTQLWCNHNLFAQACTGGTPVVNINLTASKDSIWTSGSITRAGSCCSDNNCVEFNVTISPNSNGIKLDIISGAIPGGALAYTIGCGTPQQFGQAVCLTGVGPHRITFCKPGNNANVYRITAIPKPNITGTLISSVACGVYLKAGGYVVNSGLVWNSVPNNATNNGFLSCTSNCDSVRITPTSVTYPITLKYRVCGTVMGGCVNTTSCDTASVTIVDNPKVTLPDSVKICFGSPSTLVSSSISGGLSPYSYTWSGGGTASSKSLAVGSHIISATDSLGCFTTRDTVIVSNYSGAFVANAGNDTAICSSQNIFNLNGQIQIASGGKWSGGLGVFNPNDATLNSSYSPTVAEKAQGFVNLILSTNNNFGCANKSDSVKLTINPLPSPIVSGDTIPCSTKIKSYTVPAVNANTYIWDVTRGTIIGSSLNNTVTIRWGAAGIGAVTLQQTSNLGCSFTINQSVNISPLPTGATLFHY